MVVIENKTSKPDRLANVRPLLNLPPEFSLKPSTKTVSDIRLRHVQIQRKKCDEAVHASIRMLTGGKAL